jgi:hypothetical protein
MCSSDRDRAMYAKRHPPPAPHPHDPYLKKVLVASGVDPELFFRFTSSQFLSIWCVITSYSSIQVC